MNLLGFEHVFSRARVVSIAQHCQVRVVDLPVYALLKIVAFLDRPIERSKDIEDLSALFDQYEVDSDRFYLEPPSIWPPMSGARFFWAGTSQFSATKQNRS